MIPCLQRGYSSGLREDKAILEHYGVRRRQQYHGIRGIRGRQLRKTSRNPPDLQKMGITTWIPVQRRQVQDDPYSESEKR